jgi:hypothetical protein
VDANTLSNFLVFGLGIATTAVAIILAKNGSKLLRGRSIKEVVESANAVIDMYEKHVGALELKVGDLEKQIGDLKTTLDDTLRHNIVLQNLLMASQPIHLPENK